MRNRPNEINRAHSLPLLLLYFICRKIVNERTLFNVDYECESARLCARAWGMRIELVSLIKHTIVCLETWAKEMKCFVNASSWISGELAKGVKNKFARNYNKKKKKEDDDCLKLPSRWSGCRSPHSFKWICIDGAPINTFNGFGIHFNSSGNVSVGYRLMSGWLSTMHFWPQDCS